MYRVSHSARSEMEFKAIYLYIAERSRTGATALANAY